MPEADGDRPRCCAAACRAATVQPFSFCTACRPCDAQALSTMLAGQQFRLSPQLHLCTFVGADAHHMPQSGLQELLSELFCSAVFQLWVILFTCATLVFHCLLAGACAQRGPGRRTSVCSARPELAATAAINVHCCAPTSALTIKGSVIRENMGACCASLQWSRLPVQALGQCWCCDDGLMGSPTDCGRVADAISGRCAFQKI